MVLYAKSFRTNEIKRRLEKIREVKKKTNNNNLGANKLLNTKLALQLNPRIKM